MKALLVKVKTELRVLPRLAPQTFAKTTTEVFWTAKAKHCVMHRKEIGVEVKKNLDVPVLLEQRFFFSPRRCRCLRPPVRLWKLDPDSGSRAAHPSLRNEVLIRRLLRVSWTEHV